MKGQTVDIKQATKRLYNYLVAFVGDNGYPPRRCNVANDLGLSIHMVDRALVRLRGAGRICERSLLTVCR